MLDRRLPSSEGLLGLRSSPEKIGVAGRQALPLLELLESTLGVVSDQPLVGPARQISLGPFRGQGHRLLRCLLGALSYLGRGDCVRV